MSVHVPLDRKKKPGRKRERETEIFAVIPCLELLEKTNELVSTFQLDI